MLICVGSAFIRDPNGSVRCPPTEPESFSTPMNADKNVRPNMPTGIRHRCQDEYAGSAQRLVSPESEFCFPPARSTLMGSLGVFRTSVTATELSTTSNLAPLSQTLPGPSNRMPKLMPVDDCAISSTTLYGVQSLVPVIGRPCM